MGVPEVATAGDGASRGVTGGAVCGGVKVSAGLHKVVIGAALQSLHPVLHRIARGQHQDQRLIPRRPQALQDAQAVEPGHQPVEHHHVGALRLHLRQGLITVGGAADLKTLVSQSALQHPLKLRIIVYDKNRGHRASCNLFV